MFAHLLLLTVVLLAVSAVRLVRGQDGLGRLYLLWVGGLLAAGCAAILDDDRFVGAIAIGLTTVSVVVPWVLEGLTRMAFGSGQLVWGVRLTSFRAMLMPGSGLSLQLPILRGLAKLERDGVDSALGHFRELAHRTEDDHELMLIDEQIVSMLFYSERWSEGISHYERRFSPGYAALRPPLALALVRAYGETSNLDSAARLLRGLEEGPVSRDPRAAELLGQARLTFLAYAGAAGALQWVAEHDRYEDLGLSPAAATFYRGVALGRAGEVQQAESTLRRVEALAGPRDQRLWASAQRRIEALGEGAAHLEPELRSYAQGVAQRLMGFLRAAPGWRMQGRRPWVTYTLMIGQAAVYGVVLAASDGGPGLIRMGALTRELWSDGAWERVFTAAWLHHDLLSLLAAVYALWLAGQVVERVLGPARMLILALLPAAVGGALGAYLTPHLIVPSTASLTTIGVLAGALWALLPSKTPTVAPRARRNLVVTLSALAIITLLMVLPATLGSPTSPVAILATAVMASLLVLPAPTLIGRPREDISHVREWLVGGAAVLLAALVLFAVWRVAETPRDLAALEGRRQCSASGVEFEVPERFVLAQRDPQELYGLPIYEGLVDRLELDARAAGGVVQLLVIPVAPEAADGQPALFRRDEELGRRVGVTAADDLSDAYDPSWRAYDLRINGRVIARSHERRVADADGRPVADVVLVSAPADSLRHSASLYAAMLASARWSAEANADDLLRCRNAP